MGRAGKGSKVIKSKEQDSAFTSTAELPHGAPPLMAALFENDYHTGCKQIMHDTILCSFPSVYNVS